jgi:acetylornithine deacetylase
MINHKNQIVEFLQSIVQEPSVQGNESAAQKIIANKLTTLGLKVDEWIPDGEELVKHPYFCSTRTSFSESPNVVGIWEGTGNGKSIILNGHVDVVPIGDLNQWEEDPFSGVIKDGKMYGRGVTDMKGGQAAMIYAIECLKSLSVSLKGTVIFQSVIEEESGGAGTLASILRGYTADAAIIPEPSGMKIFPKQQGSAWFRIKVKGRSAHGGTRYEGISAIDKTMLVLQEIARLEERRNQRIKDPLYDNTPIPIPINVGIIKGGEWPSSVPDEVEVEGRVGIAPNEEMEHAKQELESVIMNIQDKWLQEVPPDIEWFGAQWIPGSVESDHELMTDLAQSFFEVKQKKPIIEASPWGTDGGLLARVGNTPSIVFGPGITSVAHYPNENIDLDSVIDCAEIIALTICKWCTKENDE